MIMSCKWLSWVMAVLMIAGGVMTASAGTLDEIAQRGELRVACQTQGPPLQLY
jgi:polar amino acid transport system substrate-binding protein